ncbi:MAG: hypothetical protein JWN07_3314, partial [Hyphomicrobiales bacterium]|nr:hypothetical protein [Hyphomicrobiales bacterium]
SRTELMFQVAILKATSHLVVWLEVAQTERRFNPGGSFDAIADPS